MFDKCLRLAYLVRGVVPLYFIRRQKFFPMANVDTSELPAHLPAAHPLSRQPTDKTLRFLLNLL